MSDVFIDHLSFALGDETHSVEDAAKNGKTLSTAAVLREAGFIQHHVCRDGASAYDLAKRAVEPIRASLGDIGAIVYATCIPINSAVCRPKSGCSRDAGHGLTREDFRSCRRCVHRWEGGHGNAA